MIDSRLASIDCVPGAVTDFKDITDAEFMMKADRMGFEQAGFSSREIEIIMGKARTILHTVFQDAPEEIIGQLPAQIPLYVGQNGDGRPHCVWEASPSEEYVYSTGISRLPHVLHGIFIPIHKLDDGHMSPESEHDLAHEFTHVPLNVIADTNVNESFAQRLTQLHCPPAPDGRMGANVIPESLFGTCGLRGVDGSYSPDTTSNDLRRIKYASAATSLRHLTAREVWDICGEIIRTSQSTATVMRTTNEQVDAAIRTVSPKKAPQILSSLPFRPIEKGPQQFLYQVQGDGTFVTTVRFLENASFGREIEKGMRMAIQYVPKPLEAPTTLTAVSADGVVLAKMETVADPTVKLNFQALVEAFRQQSTNIPTIGSIECTIGMLEVKISASV
jgi:hypothetical protein